MAEAADVPRYLARHVWSKKPTKMKYTEIDEFDVNFFVKVAPAPAKMDSWTPCKIRKQM
jgi:hypothetical protein